MSRFLLQVEKGVMLQVAYEDPTQLEPLGRLSRLQDMTMWGDVHRM